MAVFMFLSPTVLELKLSILLQTQNALRHQEQDIKSTLVERKILIQFLANFPKHIEQT